MTIYQEVNIISRLRNDGEVENEAIEEGFEESEDLE